MIPSRTLTAALALALSLCAPFASPQTAAAPSPQPSPGMPKDPAALMQLAEQVNGLTGPGMKPWYVKATYQTYDEQGKPKDQGTFEEWWAAPDKDRRVYTSATFNQTEYTTGAGKFRIGDQHEPPLAEFVVRDRLVDPMPTAEDLRNAPPRNRESPFSKWKVTCVELARPMKRASMSPVGLFPTYCFDPEKPMLRFSGSYGILNTVYERIGQLDGHFLGTDIQIVDRGKQYVTIHLETGVLLANVNDADFIPPANATMLPAVDKARLDGKVVNGRKIGGSAPAYPAIAKQEGVEGPVLLDALIGEDGNIRELTVTSAPDPLLAVSALMAVRDWKYTPYQLNGHPVEVATEIKVVYQLH